MPRRSSFATARAPPPRPSTAASRGRSALFDQGKFEEASRAAGEVLSVAPGNADAKRIMADGAARSRGRGAEEAQGQVARAKAAARSAGAQRLAPAAYAAAVAAERDAQRLYQGGRPGDATVKFYEASGLFRSAEIAAQNEARPAKRWRRPAPPAPQNEPTSRRAADAPRPPDTAAAPAAAAAGLAPPPERAASRSPRRPRRRRPPLPPPPRRRPRGTRAAPPAEAPARCAKLRKRT